MRDGLPLPNSLISRRLWRTKNLCHSGSAKQLSSSFAHSGASAAVPAGTFPSRGRRWICESSRGTQTDAF